MAKVTFSGHGIVLRTSALKERGVSRGSVVEAMDGEPLDEDPRLLSFGPHFGGEACDEYVRRLQGLGFQHVEDFFELQWDHPEWLEFAAQAKPR